MTHGHVDILLVGKLSKKEANEKKNLVEIKSQHFKSQHFTSTLFEEGVKLSMLIKMLTIVNGLLTIQIGPPKTKVVPHFVQQKLYNDTVEYSIDH